MVVHNLQNYDLQHICLALQSCEPTTTGSVIPSNDEKYFSMNFEVLVETITRDDGKVIEKSENLRFIDSIKMMGQNIQNYDLHHIRLALQSCEPTTTVSVIPPTDEKYFSINFEVLVETTTRNDGKVIKKSENLRFIDSFKMMNSSLEELIDFLPRGRFRIFALVFPNLSSTELKLLQQKRYYPYSYVSGQEKKNYHLLRNGGTLRRKRDCKHLQTRLHAVLHTAKYG